jgi:hypothetical protein
MSVNHRSHLTSSWGCGVARRPWLGFARWLASHLLPAVVVSCVREWLLQGFTKVRSNWCTRVWECNGNDLTSFCWSLIWDDRGLDEPDSVCGLDEPDSVCGLDEPDSDIAAIAVNEITIMIIMSKTVIQYAKLTFWSLWSRCAARRCNASAAGRLGKSDE